MTTGHTSKAALGAARIALLAGVSAAALSLYMTAAHADGLTYNDNTGAPTASYGWNGLTYTNIDSATYANSTTGFTTVVGSAGVLSTDSSGNGTVLGAGGFFTGDIGTNNAVLITPNLGVVVGNVTNGTGAMIAPDGSVGSTNGITSAGFNGAGFAAYNGPTGPGSGPQTFGVDAATGNMFTTGTATIGGLLTANNGAVVTGNTTTDSLTVNQGASFAGGATTIDGTTGNIHTDGNLSVNGTTNLNGGVVVVGGTKTDTLTVTNGADITGGTKTDTLTVTDKSTFGVTGNTTIGANGSVTVGTNQNKAPLTVNGVTTLNGNTTVNGNTQLNGNLSVANGGNISMGNNVVHDVATPIVGTDATNKAYVDKGVNKAYEGTAIALAISQPVFLPGQTFAIRGGWGDYEGQNAFGVSAAGVIAHNVLGYGSTLALDGGIGVGSNNGVAGKAGVTVGFGGGSAPLK